MIVYRIARSAETPAHPAWLDGAASLALGESDAHRFAGIGVDWLLHQPDHKPWADVDDGWQALRVLPDEPIALARRVAWARVRLVADAEGRQWQVPEIHDAQGRLAIVAALGDDWLPAYTPAQSRLIAIASAASAALAARDLPAQASAQWAAEILASANHVTVATIQRLRLLDQSLVTAVLLAATGILAANEAEVPA